MPSTSTSTMIRTGRKSISPLHYGHLNRSLKSELSSDELDDAIARVLAPEVTQDREYKEMEVFVLVPHFRSRLINWSVQNESWKEHSALQMKIDDLQACSISCVIDIIC